MRTTEAPATGIEVCSTLEVRGTTLVVNVNKRDKWSAYTPTVEIPLEHVLGAEADPEIERTMWRAWVLDGPASGGRASSARTARTAPPTRA